MQMKPPTSQISTDIGSLQILTKWIFSVNSYEVLLVNMKNKAPPSHDIYIIKSFVNLRSIDSKFLESRYFCSYNA